MSHIILIGTILSLHVFAWLMPGPLFILIVRNSLLYSHRSGVYTAIGIACANFVHITYAVLCLTFLLSSVTSLMIFAQYLGAGYLAYLGFKTLRMKVTYQDLQGSKEVIQDLDFFSAFRMGFLTNILSPKAALFFTSIFASLLSLSSPHWVVAFLWIAMPLNSFFMASILSLFFTQKIIRNLYMKHEKNINKFLAATLLILAALIALGH